MVTIISKWLQLSLNSYIVIRWEHSLSSAFADAPKYHKIRSYLTYDVSAATTIIAVKRRNCHIRLFTRCKQATDLRPCSDGIIATYEYDTTFFHDNNHRAVPYRQRS